MLGFSHGSGCELFAFGTEHDGSILDGGGQQKKKNAGVFEIRSVFIATWDLLVTASHQEPSSRKASTDYKC